MQLRPTSSKPPITATLSFLPLIIGEIPLGEAAVLGAKEVSGGLGVDLICPAGAECCGSRFVWKTRLCLGMLFGMALTGGRAAGAGAGLGVDEGVGLGVWVGWSLFIKLKILLID